MIVSDEQNIRLGPVDVRLAPGKFMWSLDHLDEGATSGTSGSGAS
jgi:hypothetical protein